MDSEAVEERIEYLGGLGSIRDSQHLAKHNQTGSPNSGQSDSLPSTNQDEASASLAKKSPETENLDPWEGQESGACSKGFQDPVEEFVGGEAAWQINSEGWNTDEGRQKETRNVILKSTGSRYKSLGDALRQASDGDEILLTGVHVESEQLVLRQAGVSIRANPERHENEVAEIILTSRVATILCLAEGVRVEGLRIIQVLGPSSDEAHVLSKEPAVPGLAPSCIQIIKGSTCIDSCFISSFFGYGIAMAGDVTVQVTIFNSPAAKKAWHICLKGATLNWWGLVGYNLVLNLSSSLEIGERLCDFTVPWRWDTLQGPGKPTRS